jgi:glutamate racemase
MSNKQLLVFDSGLGGLSICREIIAVSPTLQMHYLSDNAAFPYGSKTQQAVTVRALEVIEAALETIQADMLVVACNTASTAVLPTLREHLNIPVVGVVPAIKTAAALTRSGTIGLLATPGTVAREYTKTLITQHAANTQVISVGSSALVELIEAHIHGNHLDIDAVAQILREFDGQPGGEKIDSVVLGCTHFPLIRDVFIELRQDWQWIDSGAAIAARVCSLLNRQPTPLNEVCHVSRQAWFTQNTSTTEKLTHYLLQHGFDAPQLLPRSSQLTSVD